MHAGERKHEPDRPQQNPEDRRPERLPEMALDAGLEQVEAAGRKAIPDLAGGSRGPMAGLVPVEEVAPQEDERGGDEQPADHPQDGQSGPSFPLFPRPLAYRGRPVIRRELSHSRIWHP